MADDEFSMLAGRVLRIIVNPGERIAENCDRFLEGHAVLLEVLRGLSRIPGELQAHSILPGDSREADPDECRAGVGLQQHIPAAARRSSPFLRRSINAKQNCERLTACRSAGARPSHTSSAMCNVALL